MLRSVSSSKSSPASARWQAGGVTVLAALVLWAAGAGPAFGARGGEQPGGHVTLQLKWLHQFQFAGYYAAQAKGFYRDEGLEVTIRQGGPGQQAIGKVLSGEAQFAIGDTDLLLNRFNGQPVVALAAIFQHSPYVLLSRQDRNIRAPSDLVGAKVMLSKGQGPLQLSAMLKREGIDPMLVDTLVLPSKLEDLIEGKVDAVSAYATVEPALLRARGVAPATMRSLDYGVDFYGDILFTTEAEIAENPERTAAFLRATRKGWDYALSHVDEIADLILGMDGVAARGLTRETLTAEAVAMRPFILSDVVEIGHMNLARFEHIARTLADMGLVRADYSLAGWVYEPDPGVDPRLLRWMAGIGTALLVGVVLVLLWNMQIRRKVRERTQELQQEVNHRTEVQQQLKVSQEMVQLMFGAAAAGISLNTPDGRFLMANPAYHATVGYTADDLRTMDTRELTHPDDRPHYAGLRDRMLAGEFDSYSTEKRYVRKDGGVVWVRSKVSAVRSADGVPAYLIAVTDDITARRATEEKLRQSEVLLEIAGRTAQLGGWLLDLPADRMLWSDEVCKIHDMPVGSKPLLRDVLNYYAPEWRQKITVVFAACIRGGISFDVEMEVINASGRRVWIRTIAEALRDGNGKVTRIHGSCQDITERKQAQESILRLNAELEDRVRRRTAQLEAVNKELEAFSYSVSHDLRSPLNTIDGFCLLLERAAGDQVGERGRHYLNRIRAGARQMGELIQGLLSLAKLARDPLRSAVVDLTVIAQRIVLEWRERESERQVQVHIQEGLLAHGDPLLLSVVMDNLLGNAWKFTAKQPAARIDVGREAGADGETVYFVKDNGAGFDMAFAEKLFGTFQRLHSPTDFAGTGIGLATVQRIISRHGGRVWAHAVEGQGASFYFTVGAAKTGRTPAAAG